MVWSVKKELPSQLIILHRITGEFKVVNKEKTAPDATNIESGEADQKLTDLRSASILPNK